MHILQAQENMLPTPANSSVHLLGGWHCYRSTQTFFSLSRFRLSVSVNEKNNFCEPCEPTRKLLRTNVNQCEQLCEPEKQFLLHLFAIKKMWIDK